MVISGVFLMLIDILTLDSDDMNPSAFDFKVTKYLHRYFIFNKF